MATEASASASAATTAPNVRGPTPQPPTSPGGIGASSPASPSGASASVENRPGLAFCPAEGASARPAISRALETATSWLIAHPAPAYSAADGPLQERILLGSSADDPAV